MNNKIGKVHKHRHNKRYKRLNKPEYSRDHHIILRLETTDGSEDVTLVPWENFVYYSHTPFRTCRPVIRKTKINGNR